MVFLHFREPGIDVPVSIVRLPRPMGAGRTVLARRGCLRAACRRRGFRSPALRIARRPAGTGGDEIAASVAIKPLRLGLIAARRRDIARAVAHEILTLVASQALAARFLATLCNRPWLRRRGSGSRGLLLRRCAAGRGAGKQLCALREGDAGNDGHSEGCNECFHAKVSLIRAPWTPFSKPPLAGIWRAA